ncbi:MAG: Fe-S cluster assembly protein SufD [Rudaea sp.]|nr:Fe-S cluster assembly protein SufD [Rudaea sp.]
MDSAVLDDLLGGSAREREETWRYSKTAIRALTQQAFAIASPDATPSAETLERIDLPFTRGRRIVIVNGGYSQRYSDIGRLASTISLRHESALHLNISIVAGCADPLHLVHVSVPDAAASRWRAVCEVDIGGGRAELIEQHVGEPGADVFGAATSTIALGPQAELRVAVFSDLPDSVSLLRKVHCTVGDAAVFTTTHAHFGGRLQRIESTIDMAGTKASCGSRGVFALRGREHVDVRLDVHHSARDTSSKVFWRGVADQRSRGIFHGAITVAAGADGADAQLSNKNLLLSANAEIDTQPVLEIYADEVKASHGATVGQLDEHVLFYLRSRGIPAAAARNLLIAAFCREVFDGIGDDALREHLDAALVARLPAAEAEA